MRKDLVLGAAVGSVIADHERVDHAAAGDVGGEPALVAGYAEPVDGPIALRLSEISESAAGTGYLPPLFRPLDVVERENIDVVAVQRGQDRAELANRLGSRTRPELDAYRDRAAQGPQAGNGRAIGIRCVGAFRLAGPVEKVHA